MLTLTDVHTHIGLAADKACEVADREQLTGDAAVFGKAHPGSKVSVKLGSVEGTTTAGTDGKWRATLAGLKPTEQGKDLVVSSGEEVFTAHDVIVGEVWIGSGQSNMDWVVKNTSAAADAKARPADAGLRVAPVRGTGVAALDALLGRRGLPDGITLLRGALGSGRTTLALRALAATQTAGGAAAWIDASHSFDPLEAATRGVALRELPILVPLHTGEAIEMAGALLADADLAAVVLAGAALTGPRVEVLRDAGLAASLRV